MSDLIDRQAAIDAIDKLSDEPIGYLEAAIDALVDLPAADPEKTDCATCKHGHFGSVQCNRCSVGFPNNYERDERYG